MYEILNPRKVDKGAFFGTCTVKINETGLLIKEVKVFQKGSNSWIAFPTKEYEVKGVKKYIEYIAYDTEEKTKEVKQSILEAIEAFREKNPEFEKQGQNTFFDKAPF